jgi:hypothetical protein
VFDRLKGFAGQSSRTFGSRFTCHVSRN